MKSQEKFKVGDVVVYTGRTGVLLAGAKYRLKFKQRLSWEVEAVDCPGLCYMWIGAKVLEKASEGAEALTASLP